MTGCTTGALRAALAALPLVLARAAAAAPDPGYAEALIAKAHRLGLARDPHWLRLGHWRKYPLTGYRSDAAGPDFFVDPQGRTDPAAELEADLRAFFGATEQPQAEVARGLMPPVCRFPARLAVLRQKLELDVDRLDLKPCPKLDEYWGRVQPESVSLIFSAYYLNNPASMFGHTFLRVRKRGPAAGRQQRELLDNAIDYSADADTGNPVLYAFKGLFGFFPGTFKLRPYFYKVREYNDFESRDLFEYELALSEGEVALLVAHLFELGSTYFDYYYADENCSYQILAALEAASPRLVLLDHLGTPVVPIDTVKALYANPGLVREVQYRPSATTQFNARVAGMPRDQRTLVEALAHDGNTPLPERLSEEERIHVLDASADLVDVRYAKELPYDPGGEGARIKQRVLERRAALLRPSEPLRIDPPGHLPHDTHESAQLFSGALWSDADGGAATLGGYLALHGLEDPLGGYPDLAQIEFFPAELRILGRGPTLQLERLHLVDALSLHAMTSFDQRISWKVRGGVERVRDAGCASCLAGTLVIGSGVAAEAGPAVLFATADFLLQLSEALRGFEFAPALRAGVGPAAGVRLRAGERFTAMVTGNAYWLPDAAGPWTWAVEGAVRYVLSSDVSLGISARKLPAAAEAGLALFLFH
jgi:hypothetical protein